MKLFSDYHSYQPVKCKCFMTDTELQYIETLKKDCQPTGTWAELITSYCLQLSVVEAREKVLYFSTFYTSYIVPFYVTISAVANGCFWKMTQVGS